MINRMKNERGLTLIELLAVIVILGIISSIAVISIGNVIQKAKDQAIVSKAYALKEAAELYAKQVHVSGNAVTTVTYKTLVNENYIDRILDPDTRTYIEPSNASYVNMNGLSAVSVCFIGENRNLCTAKDGSSSVPIDELSTDIIQNN